MDSGRSERMSIAVTGLYGDINNSDSIYFVNPVIRLLVQDYSRLGINSHHNRISNQFSADFEDLRYRSYSASGFLKNDQAAASG